MSSLYAFGVSIVAIIQLVVLFMLIGEAPGRRPDRAGMTAGQRSTTRAAMSVRC
jgi:hypothetical protein